MDELENIFDSSLYSDDFDIEEEIKKTGQKITDELESTLTDKVKRRTIKGQIEDD